MMDKALEAWMACAELRARRERYKRFTYGRQWDDPVRDPDTGKVTTEREVLSRDRSEEHTSELQSQR